MFSTKSQEQTDRRGGYHELLAISFPLILSTSSAGLMHIVDRIFLAWYSPDALAASLPGGIGSFVFISFFLGTAGYAGTFVSQYDGAQRPDRIGAAVWQGIYFSLIASVAIAGMAVFGRFFFTLAGHPESILELEIQYYRILTLGGGGPIFSAALSSFYSGRGKTFTVMWVNVFGALLNGILDYCWIFGLFGFPEKGIVGAALATITAAWVMVLIYLILFFMPRNNQLFQTRSGWHFEKDLFLRLLRYGTPSGLQFMLDIMAITGFILFVGRLGEAELAATNVAFTINHLVFMPMIGLAIGTSILVGRYIGAGEPDVSARATRNAYFMTFCYMGGFSLCLFTFPGVFVALFAPKNPDVDFSVIEHTGKNLLYFVGAYSFLDATYIVYSSALKGAGDTHFLMWLMLGVSLSVLIIPVGVACYVFSMGVYVAWFFLALYVVALASGCYLRYRTGKWRTMKVIEHQLNPAVSTTEGPLVETF